MDTARYDLIRTIEERSLNAWPPLQQMLYDGWILRFANGHTKRANSINPVYPGIQPVGEKIKRCESIYQRQTLTPIFRITPLTDPQLDAHLDCRNYPKQDVVSVQICDLTNLQSNLSDLVQLSEHVTPDWFDGFTQFANVSEGDRLTLTAMLHNIIPQTCFATLFHQGSPAACGLAVVEDGYVGLFEIVTDPQKRRQGFAQTLISSLLHWAGDRGAKTAYLQVLTSNQAALNLYAKLGFRELYQYFYRTLNLRPLH
ncbi:MAG TPA: GNAT family N-acetyltransferase [Crinalium sp.]|jgi:ribosomal protein S18 acetylase RimI-like enzyme